MAKENDYNVRIQFRHGNAMSLDLKGCGSIYIEPNKDYFFEHAPMQFINYLTQLHRLGITYRLTDDKKGCYMTIDLNGYQTNEPKTVLGNLRSNRVTSDRPIVRHNTIKDEDPKDVEVEDLIPKGTFKEDVKEIVLDNIQEPEVTEPIEPPTEEVPEVKGEEVNPEPPVESEVKVLSEEELEALNKPKLIEYAKSLGIQDVSDILKKKEIKDLILNKLKELA